MKDTSQFILSFIIWFIIAIIIMFPVFFIYIFDTHDKVVSIYNAIYDVQNLWDLDTIKLTK